MSIVVEVVCQDALAAMLRECLKSLQFGAACFAKVTQRIYCTALHQLSHLREGFVRRKIRVDNHSNDRLRFFNHGRARQNAHSAYQGVDPDQFRNLRLVMYEGVEVQLRSLIDELPVQLLPPSPVLRELRGPALATQGEPG
jgi:hypothetical protein